MSAPHAPHAADFVPATAKHVGDSVKTTFEVVGSFASDVVHEPQEAAKQVASGIADFIQDFFAFISRGNVLDLAVAIIVGQAFTAIVNSLVNDMIAPIIGLRG